MVDGVASLMTMHFGYRQAGFWHNARGSNAVDGGSPYYTTYKTLDGKYMAVGAVEKRFYRELIERLASRMKSCPIKTTPPGGANSKTAWLWPLLQRPATNGPRFSSTATPASPPCSIWMNASTIRMPRPGAFLSAVTALLNPSGPRFSRTPGEIRGAPVDPRADTRGALLAWECQRTGSTPSRQPV